MQSGLIYYAWGAVAVGEDEVRFFTQYIKGRLFFYYIDLINQKEG